MTRLPIPIPVLFLVTQALALVLFLVAVPITHAASAPTPADRDLADYFRSETAHVAGKSAVRPASLADWQAGRESVRQELQDMLGLLPFPERTDLRPAVTGRLEGSGIIVEKLHFQSQPGLYVTANLYRPATQSGPLPAILYVCGHARVFTNGVSCGNKTAYQHHGIWFARHGYVSLLIDTLQLGEIEGHHHGTHRLGQWWWNSRGYTPAGVEAWNGIRAIDYLVSRPEVDASRIGITGRSGGGSYSWTTAALDDRIRVAAPVAGITDLHNHVVDGTVEGHCDCMFFVNTFRWDFARHAALLAPRPLLIVNTDSDTIFPLDGVQRIHAATREIYRLHRSESLLGLVTAPGPHKDTQDLQVPVFRWFNQHLKGVDPLIAEPAERLFSPLDLRVFGDAPTDQRNTVAAEWFGPATTSESRQSIAHGDPGAAIARLKARTFAGWPDRSPVPEPHLVRELRRAGWHSSSWKFESQPYVPFEIHVVTRDGPPAERVVVRIVEDREWEEREARLRDSGPDAFADEVPAGAALAWFAPRGLGSGRWSGDERHQIQIRRRFMLLGQTLDGMRVWDILNAVNAVGRGPLRGKPVELRASGRMSANALLASLFLPEVGSARLEGLPPSFLEGPDYLNILQVLDIPDALRLAHARGVAITLE
ncbi:MAG: alpha/beta hydrolase family protein [Limisphaerales bacterium]